MRRQLLGMALLLAATRSVVAAEDGLKDLYFGEALFYAKQGEYFDAISRLDTELTQYYGVDEPQLDSLNFHINEAEFSVGDIELSYRMHRRAGRAIKAVIEGNVPPAVRNEAIYRLARIYFQKEQNINAQQTIERIEGELPPRIVNDVTFLKGQIYMTVGRFAEAEELFASLEGEQSHTGFASYNLGIAQFAQGKEEEGIASLARAGQIDSSERAVQAIKDKANLVLASHLLENGRLELAQQYFSRVRLDGPFSNRALLGYGWTHVKRDNYERALVPWSMLFKRNVTDPSVQDAILGVPYSYGKLGLYGKAATLYNSALGSIGGELDKLDASIKSIKQGKFLEALVREEIKQDPGWMVKLRELGNTPETYYLMELMASHDFQSSLQNYLDLEALRKRLDSWEEYYASYEEMITIRRGYYEPLLPTIDEQFRQLDSRIRLRLEQRDRINTRLRTMLISPRPEYLTTAGERILKEQIAGLEKRLGAGAQDLENPLAHRINRLKGYLLWNITNEYDERLTEAFKHLADLDQDIGRLKKIYGSFVRTRQAATQSYEGYDEQIRRLRIKTGKAMEKVKQLMARQGHMLEVMAVNTLEKRREKLEQAQVKARFAMAESYDRATMQQQAPQPAKAGADAPKTPAPGSEAIPAQQDAPLPEAPQEQQPPADAARPEEIKPESAQQAESSTQAPEPLPQTDEASPEVTQQETGPAAQ